MLTTNNNDILFDDLAMIASTLISDSAAGGIMYGDCGNRYEPENAEDLNPFGNTFLSASLDGKDNIAFSRK